MAGDRTGMEIFEIVCCVDFTVVVEAVAADTVSKTSSLAEATAAAAVAAAVAMETAAAVLFAVTAVIGDDGSETVCS